ncbi:MAG: hypothetical protein WCY75_07915 [Sulfurimonadaceae bacterium]|nr:hypothetical protein [Candidatus Cloacimonadota bacterium]
MFLLMLHLFAIFIFNGFLFEPSYMPDQFRYLEIAKDIRIFNVEEIILHPKNNVFFSGLFFGLFPIPFIESVYSLGMINYLLFVYVFVFMHKRNYLNSKFITYFYLFFPSLLLYSSLALRDMLVFCILFLGIYYLIFTKSYVQGIFLFVVLYFIKFQNLIFVMIAFVMSIIKIKRINFSKLLLIILTISLLIFLFSNFLAIEKLNFYRWAFYNENLGKSSELFVPILSYTDLLIHFIPSSLNFLFRPLPWEEFGILQLVQFVENIFLGIIIFVIITQNYKYKLWMLSEVKFLNFFLFLSLIVYGLVIYNSGTAVRYKFPFIAVYIIYSWYFIYQAKQLLKKSDICAE